MSALTDTTRCTCERGVRSCAVHGNLFRFMESRGVGFVYVGEGVRWGYYRFNNDDGWTLTPLVCNAATRARWVSDR